MNKELYIIYIYNSILRGIRLPNAYPGHDTKQSDGVVPIMLGLWGMRSTSSLPFFPGPHWPRVLAPDRPLSMGQIELFDIYTECKQMAC